MGKSQRRSDEGTRGFVARLRGPGGVFSGFQYPTPPLHLFAQDRAAILRAMNQAVTRLYVQEDTDQGDQAA
jgi:hypothetical protein